MVAVTLGRARFMQRLKPALALVICAAFLSSCAAVPPSARQPDSGTTQEKSVIEQVGVGFYQEVSWSPDGKALSVSILELSDTTEGFQYRVHLLDTAAAELAALTSGPMDLWTSWSPDGSRIAYASRVAGASDIFVVRADGTDRTQLTDDPADDTQPDWSPDGGHIAFVSKRGGTEQVYVMTADGSEQVRVGASERSAQNPNWSPDGSRIAYFETDAAGMDEIFVINADGTERRRVASGVWPHWSPDGSRILFGAPEGLSLISADATSKSLLISGAQFGVFSPDGSKIAYIKTTDGHVSVYVMDSDGSRPVRLLTRPAPNWK